MNKKVKPLQLLFILCLLTTIASAHQQFQSYLDPWNSLVTLEGQFDKNHTLFKYATCDPCDYVIVVYKDFVRLLIDDPQKGKEENILSFEFKVDLKHVDQTIWDFDTHKFSLQKKSNVNEQVQRTTKKGLQWSYELTLPIQGLIIKGHSQFLYANLIPLITFIFSIIFFITFPLSGQGRKEQLIEIPRRTPISSLVILAQLQHILFVQVIVLMIKYILYEESYLFRAFWYILYMIPFGFLCLQIVYLYDSIRIRYNTSFAKVQAVRLKDLGLVIVLLGAIYGGSFTLLMIGKGLWVFGYFGMYFIWQTIDSLMRKNYPYLPLSGYYLALVGYQIFLANFEPLFWYEQNTWTQIAAYLGVLIGIFIIGSVIQKFVIGIQRVNQVVFEESRNIEMGDASSAKSTEVNLET